MLNMTIGGHASYANSILTVGYSVPVTADRGFDGEFRAFINRYF
jgi:hypothetical protein